MRSSRRPPHDVKSPAEGDGDLAEMRARSHVVIGCLRLRKGKDLVDHRLDDIRFHRAVHGLEHLCRTDGNAQNIGAARTR
jgi:hypothetical protein